MPASHSIIFRVRYNECDPMSVAHHTAYPVWFEMGRTEMLRTGPGGGRGGRAGSTTDSWSATASTSPSSP